MAFRNPALAEQIMQQGWSVDQLRAATIALGFKGFNAGATAKNYWITILSNGGKTAAEIGAAIAAAPAVPAAAPAVQADAPIGAVVDLALICKAVDAKIAAVRSGFEASIRQSVQGVVDTLVNKLGSEVSDLRITAGAEIQGLRAGIGDVRTDMQAWADTLSKQQKSGVDKLVNASVADAVGQAFAPLRAAIAVAPVEVQERVAVAVQRQRVPTEDVFGFKLDGIATVEIWGPRGNVDPDYMFDKKALARVLRCFDRGSNAWLYGQRGTGKTQFAANLAAALGRPFFRVTCDKTTDKFDLMGGDRMVGGHQTWQDGQVLVAYKTPGAICLLDEATAVRPEYMMVMHPVLEPRSSYTITSLNVTVSRAEGMCFLAADNTNGCGDSTGRFSGTTEANSALLSRFAVFRKFDFLPQHEEVALLVKRGADKDVAASLVKVLTACRAEVGNKLVEPPSLRQAFAFCEQYELGNPAEAWEDTVVNSSPEESQEDLRQLFLAHWTV